MPGNNKLGRSNKRKREQLVIVMAMKFETIDGGFANEVLNVRSSHFAKELTTT